MAPTRRIRPAPKPPTHKPTAPVLKPQTAAAPESVPQAQATPQVHKPAPTAPQNLPPEETSKIKVRLVHGFKMLCPTQDRILWPGAVIELEPDAWVLNQLKHNCLEKVI